MTLLPWIPRIGCRWSTDLILAERCHSEINCLNLIIQIHRKIKKMDFLLTFFSKPYWYCSGGKALSVILGHKQSKRYLANSHYRRIIMYASMHSTPTSVSVLDHLQPFTQLLLFLFPCIHPSPLTVDDILDAMTTKHSFMCFDLFALNR